MVIEIDEAKLHKEGRKERIRRVWNKFLIYIEYILVTPYLEFKDFYKAVSNMEVSLMYSTFIVFLYIHLNQIGGNIKYYLATLIFLFWAYGIFKSGEFMNYYNQKYHLKKWDLPTINSKNKKVYILPLKLLRVWPFRNANICKCQFC